MQRNDDSAAHGIHPDFGWVAEHLLVGSQAFRSGAGRRSGNDLLGAG